MKSQLVLFMGALSILSACGPKGGSSAKTDDLRAEAMSAQSLTADEKAKYQAFLKGESENHPSTDIFFETSNQQQTQLKRDESSLTKFGLSLEAKIKSKCKIDPGTDQETDQGSNISTVHTKSISGDSCPISYSETSSSEIPKLPTDSKTFSGKMIFDSSSTENVLADDARKIISVVSTRNSSHTETFATNMASDSNSNLTSGTMFGNETATIQQTLKDGKVVTTNMRVQYSASVGHKSMNMLARMKPFEGTELVIGVFNTDGVTEYFINGEAYTPERLKADFGTNLNNN